MSIEELHNLNFCDNCLVEVLEFWSAKCEVIQNVVIYKRSKAVTNILLQKFCLTRLDVKPPLLIKLESKLIV